MVYKSTASKGLKRELKSLGKKMSSFKLTHLFFLSKAPRPTNQAKLTSPQPEPDPPHRGPGARARAVLWRGEKGRERTKLGSPGTHPAGPAR